MANRVAREMWEPQTQVWYIMNYFNCIQLFIFRANIVSFLIRMNLTFMGLIGQALYHHKVGVTLDAKVNRLLFQK